MATEPVSAAHADLDLLFAELARLREIAADPEQAEDHDRVYDFSIRWGVALSGRLQRLEYYHERGELDEDELRRYLMLEQQLHDALPLVDRLGLTRPR